jgi:hypothetical protein
MKDPEIALAGRTPHYDLANNKWEKTTTTPYSGKQNPEVERCVMCNLPLVSKKYAQRARIDLPYRKEEPGSDFPSRISGK